MPRKLVMPKFLTADLAQEVMREVSAFMNPAVHIGTARRLKRYDFHIVMIVPGAAAQGRNTVMVPVLLAEHSVGLSRKWPYPFDKIAKSKALQRWDDRNDDRTDVMPHLLFAGDSPFWGTVKRHSIVVACSGVQPHFDKMIAGMVADMAIARLRRMAEKRGQETYGRRALLPSLNRPMAAVSDGF